ncbi:arginine N-succinyltransferase [Pseudomonas sp. LRF_L74]|uniref:arginine N-succinyltransferase n=1 Tax=Pseudomonas sp. LRF_L74 TaxID=3369422 RepID=UPI003F5D8183
MSAWVVRPAQPGDLDALQRMARQSLTGVTSLPDDRASLERRLAQSSCSFASAVTFPGEEEYLFVLEDLSSGALLGCSGLQANCGFAQPFYSFRHEVFIHASPAQGIKHKVHALALCHDLGGNTLLKGFHIDANLQDATAAQLISRARLLFVASQPQRFATQLVAEMVGCTDEQGHSPFWDALGSHFFGLDYAAAEALGAFQERTYLAELLPHYPIYVPLLPESAQEVMGQVHPKARRPYEILLAEGFAGERYIDVYDAGPTLEAETAQIRSIAGSLVTQARIAPRASSADAPAWLVCNEGSSAFRALTVHANWLPGRPLTLSPAEADALQLGEGDSLRLVRL